MDLRHQSGAMCIIMLGGEYTCLKRIFVYFWGPRNWIGTKFGRETDNFMPDSAPPNPLFFWGLDYQTDIRSKKNTEFPRILIKYKRFHINEGSVKYKLLILMTIIVNYLFKLLFKPILTPTFPAILRSINLTYEFLSKIFL